MLSTGKSSLETTVSWQRKSKRCTQSVACMQTMKRTFRYIHQDVFARFVVRRVHGSPAFSFLFYFKRFLIDSWDDDDDDNNDVDDVQHDGMLIWVDILNNETIFPEFSLFIFLVHNILCNERDWEICIFSFCHFAGTWTLLHIINVLAARCLTPTWTLLRWAVRNYATGFEARFRMNAAHQTKLFWLPKLDGEMFIER